MGPKHAAKRRRSLAIPVTVVVLGGLFSTIASGSLAFALDGSKPHPAATPVAPAIATHRSVARSSVVVSRNFLSVADTYVAQQYPRSNFSRRGRLAASAIPGKRKVIYLRFRVRGLPRSHPGLQVVLHMHRDLHHMPNSVVRLHRVSKVRWSESRLDWKNAPRRANSTGATRSDRSDSSLVLPVHDVKGNGVFAFAVTTSSRDDVLRMESSQAAAGPTLEVTYRKPVAAVPSPTPTTSASPTATPTTSASPTATPTTSASPTATPTLSPTATPTLSPTASPSAGCTLSALLVPSCGVLLGGDLNSFGGADPMSRFSDFNAGTGLKMTLQHVYLRPGDVLTKYDVQMAETPGAILQLNWKPTYSWADGAGGNATVNAQIDNMAASIKALGDHKLFLTLYHEPENDVSGGASGCPSTIYKGSAGTPADYRAMWANVEARFAADGVTNVVWDMNYMAYSGWNCMIDDLWPGNSLVDWVFFESYSDTQSFTSATTPFYNLLTTHSDATHDYLSKPWGIGEFSTRATDASVRSAYYTGVKQALDLGTFPKLKLLSVFDAIAPGTEIDYRVAYDAQGQFNSQDLAAFTSLGQDPLVTEGAQAAAASQK